MNAGRIVINYELGANGELLVNHYIKGDLPVVTILGLLDLTRDTILHPPTED